LSSTAEGEDTKKQRGEEQAKAHGKHLLGERLLRLVFIKCPAAGL
jgi:hypothetical protein